MRLPNGHKLWLSLIRMAYFLFVDESGYDSGPSPYGVLGGFAIEDRDVWNLIGAMNIYWADLDLVRGNERAGPRPVLVLSNDLLIGIPGLRSPWRSPVSPRERAFP